MDNLELYSKVRSVPKEALKTIQGGKLKGKSDINPMWRIKTLTEQFGPCGKGWKIEIAKTWIDDGANGEKVVNIMINLYVKFAGETEWSAPILGIGGNTISQSEKGVLVTNDEAYKMAYTDAISVACKALGFAADVYYERDKTKYGELGSDNGRDDPKKLKNGGKGQTPADNETAPDNGGNDPRKKSQAQRIMELIKDTEIKPEQVTECIVNKWGNPIKVNDLTPRQFAELYTTLSEFLKSEQP